MLLLTALAAALSLVVVPTAFGTPLVPPTVTITAPDDSVSTPQLLVDDVPIVFDVAPEPGATAACILNGLLTIAPCTSPYVFQDLGDGTHSVEVSALDSEGDSASDTVSFEVNAVAPEITIVSSNPVFSQMTDQSVDFIIDDPAATAECQLDSDTPVDCTSGSFAMSGLTDGVHTVTVTATDTQSRSSSKQAKLYINSTLEEGAIRVDMRMSTMRAGRHPELLVDVRNTTDQDPKNLTTMMPFGLMGSLRAVNDKCDYPSNGPTNLLDYSVHHTDAEIDAWCSPAERAASKIGTVIVEAKIDDSIGRLKGEVYLTERLIDGEPAGLAIVVPNQISNLDLGNVVIGARMLIQTQSPISSPSQHDIEVNPAGVITMVDALPNEIVTDGHGTTEFTMLRTRMWLGGETPSGEPLLTNASSCDAREFISFMETHQGGYMTYQQPYQPTDCDYQPISASSSIEFFAQAAGGVFGAPVTSPTAGQRVGVRSTMSFAEGSTTLRRATVELPGSLVQSAAGIGIKCATVASRNVPPTCNTANTQVGTFIADTPLLEAPITGQVFIVDSGQPLPYIFLYYRDPLLGIELRLRGKATATNGPVPRIRVEFNSENGGSLADLPDAPVSSIQLDMPGSVNQGPVTEVSTGCQPADSGSFYLESHSGRAAVGLIPATFSGCPGKLNFTASSSTFAGGDPSGIGGVTTDDTPTFNFAVTGADVSPSPTFTCSIDNPAGIDGTASSPANPDYHVYWSGGVAAPFIYSTANCVDTGSTGTFTAPTSLRDGIHVFAVKSVFSVGGSTNSADPAIRRIVFEVRNGVATPVAPNASITPPVQGTTADITPTFAYTADDPDSDFQCRIDDAAFQPCPGSGGSGSVTFSDGLEIGDHTFEVRAEDNSGPGAGAEGPADSEAFTIDVPFDPQFDVTLSDLTARAHPTLHLDLTSGSNRDIRSLKFSMPNGFVGSLLGATVRCTATDAQNDSCPAPSKIGTVTANAHADLSDVKSTGDVFLTEPLVVGDPAGIAIRIRAKVGSIDLGYVSALQRLAMRGNAEGVDAISLGDIPRSVIDPVSSAEVFFHLRSISLDLVGGAGASQPLLTNPSDCTPGAFAGDFGSYSSDAAADSDPVTFQNCGSLPFYTGFTAMIDKLDSAGNPTGLSPSAGDITRFKGTIAASPDDAGVKFARLELPKSLTASATGLPIGCSVAVYEATKTCDKGEAAVIGSVVANTPVLPTPLTGKVYLGQPKLGSFIEPGYDETLRLIIQLRGLVNIDLVGRTTLKDYRAITVFDNIPDAPVTSFEVTVDKIVRVQPTACDANLAFRTITGFNLAHNGKTSNYNTDVNIDCNGKFSAVVSLGGKGKRAKASIKARADGAKLRSLEVTLPRGVKPVKKKFKKYFQILIDKKKVKGCYKLKGSKLTATLCGKSAVNLELRFKPGSLYMPKKLKKPKFVLKAVFDNGKSQVLTRTPSR